MICSSFLRNVTCIACASITAFVLTAGPAVSAEDHSQAARLVDADHLLGQDLQYTPEGIAAGRGVRIPESASAEQRNQYEPIAQEIMNSIRPALRAGLIEALASRLPENVLAANADQFESPAWQRVRAGLNRWILDPTLRDRSLLQPDPQMKAAVSEAAGKLGVSLPDDLVLPMPISR